MWYLRVSRTSLWSRHNPEGKWSGQMHENHPDSQSDLWSDWLLHRRHGDDPEYERSIRAIIEDYADRVLNGAQLASGMTLADIGTGEGLIGFRAIDRIGPSLRVLLTDISIPMLHHAETLAMQRGIREQCTFLQCSAEALKEIDDASVDVVTTRAVLAYVPDKRAALREFHRILKPGGRISVAEPILRDEALVARALKETLEVDITDFEDFFTPLVHRWKAAQFPDTEEMIANSPIVNYSERDMVRLAMDSKFSEIHLELHVNVFPSLITSWDTFLRYSPHPLAPSLNVILAEQFSLEERQFFEQILRPTVEAGQSPTIDRVAYLTAKKPFA